MDLTTYDTLILSLGALGFGIYMLVKGGNWTIDSAVFIAERFGVSELVIGFTIVAFGTSLPELVVSVNANIQGSPDIALGNVLGSNIANILLILGATAIAAPIAAKFSELARDLFLMLAATCFLIAVLMGGIITQLFGFIMMAALVAYVGWQYYEAQRKKGKAAPDLPGAEKEAQDLAHEFEEQVTFPSLPRAFGVLLLGLFFIAVGAEFLVRGAQTGALVLGVPESVIALSIVAFGTSLPELSTCLIAAAKGKGNLILGNIVGSNVFNILLIIGAAAAIRPISVTDLSPTILSQDMWVTLGFSGLLVVTLYALKGIPRSIGATYLGLYALYVAFIYGQHLL